MIDDDYYYGLAVLLFFSLLLFLLLLSQNTRVFIARFSLVLHRHFSPKTNSRERAVVDRIKRRRLFFCARTTNTNARALFFFSRHVDDD